MTRVIHLRTYKEFSPWVLNMYRYIWVQLGAEGAVK
jgi:hypothetical protein